MHIYIYIYMYIQCIYTVIYMYIACEIVRIYVYFRRIGAGLRNKLAIVRNVYGHCLVSFALTHRNVSVQCDK